MASKFSMQKPTYYRVSHIKCSRIKNLLSHSSSSEVFLPNKRTETSFSSSSSLRLISTLEKNLTENDNNNSNLVPQWREIQGCNNWDGLVEPLNPLLRQEIIRYGEFLIACYKAFDLDPNSKRYLSCKYGKKNMLNQVGMEDSGYIVTKYIYATPNVNIPTQKDSSCGRWVGYVAVSTDDAGKKLGRRDILVTFRGTVTKHEWVVNLMSSLTPARLDPHNLRPAVKVELGFLNLYTSGESNTKFGLESCRQQLLSEVSRLINKYKYEEISISIAGHSMGSSLAVLLAYDICELGLHTENNRKWDIPVTVFSFGGPRVGNVGFKERCEELGIKVLRIVNVNDPITKLPGLLLNEELRILMEKYEFPWSFPCYTHLGVELVLDFFNMQNPSCVHDLQTYINSLPSSSSPPPSPPPSPSLPVENLLDQNQETDQVGFFNEASYPFIFLLNNIMNNTFALYVLMHICRLMCGWTFEYP